MRYDIRSRVIALSAFSVLVLCVWGASYVGGRTTVAERPINLTKEGYSVGVSGESISSPLHGYLYPSTTVVTTTTTTTTTTTSTTTIPVHPDASLASEAPPDCVVFSEIPDDWEYPLPDWNENWGDMDSYPECPPDNHDAEFYRDEYEEMGKVTTTEFLPGAVTLDLESILVDDMVMAVLTNTEYTFLRFDDDVRVLQYYLDVDTDGIYGPVTRAEHIKALVRLGQWSPTEQSFRLEDVAGDGGYDYPMDPEKRCPEWEQTFLAYGLVPVDVWSYVAYKESRCRPWIINDTLNRDGSIDYGLLQINSIHRKAVFRVCDGYSLETMLIDVDCNLRMAKYLMDNTRNRLANWRIYFQ